MSDDTERSVASAGSHGDAVRSAALALYEAGRWVSVDVPRDKADAMWATLRDALGLRPGHATARGVGGTAPSLTEAEQLAVAWAAREADEWDEEDTPEVAAHADALRGLARRLF
jgi:hypothetical protein